MDVTFNNLRITTDFTLRLCALLRAHGVDVGTRQTIACLDALILLGTVTEEDLKTVYRLTLVNRKQDLFELHRLYELLIKDYLSPRLQPDSDPREREVIPEAVVARRFEYSDANVLGSDSDDLGRVEGYSVREVDHYKDFRFVPKEDAASVTAELKKLARKFASIRRRKLKAARRGGMPDLRTSVRESVRFDGEILTWRFKHKAPTHSRWLILADVSGSMEIYSIFLLNFMHSLNKSCRMRTETFVFSTRTERLTEQFRSKDFSEMLEQAARRFSGWSGGTRIGEALRIVNESYSGSVTRKTTVIIVSDGWDTGDIALLEAQMAVLSTRSKSIIWINPLKALPAYEPLAMGMAAARPYCTKFITGHSIDSLSEFASLVGAL